MVNLDISNLLNRLRNRRTEDDCSGLLSGKGEIIGNGPLCPLKSRLQEDLNAMFDLVRRHLDVSMKIVSV